MSCPRELSSVGRDIAIYMQGSGFKPQTLHLFTLRVEFLATRLLDQKNIKKKLGCLGGHLVLHVRYNNNYGTTNQRFVLPYNSTIYTIHVFNRRNARSKFSRFPHTFSPEVK
jgi:hypothetical protein